MKTTTALFIFYLASFSALALDVKSLAEIKKRPTTIMKYITESYSADDIIHLVEQESQAIHYIKRCSGKLNEANCESIISALDLHNQKVPNFLFTCAGFFRIYEQAQKKRADLKIKLAKLKRSSISKYNLSDILERNTVISMLRLEPSLFVALDDKSIKTLINYGLLQIFSHELYSFPLEFFTPQVLSELLRMSESGVSLDLPAVLLAESNFAKKLEHSREAFGKARELSAINTPSMSILLKNAKSLEEGKSLLAKSNYLYFNSTLLSSILENNVLRDHFLEVVPDGYIFSQYDYLLISRKIAAKYDDFPELLKASSQFIEIFIQERNHLQFNLPIKFSNVLKTLIENSLVDATYVSSELLCHKEVLEVLYDSFDNESSRNKSIMKKVPWDCHEKERLVTIIEKDPDLLNYLTLPKSFKAKHFSELGRCSVANRFSSYSVRSLGVEPLVSLMTTKSKCKELFNKYKSGKILTTLSSQGVQRASCGLIPATLEPIIYMGSVLKFYTHISNRSEILDLVSCPDEDIKQAQKQGQDIVSKSEVQNLAPCTLIYSNNDANGYFGAGYFRSHKLMAKDECFSLSKKNLNSLSYSPQEFTLSAFQQRMTSQTVHYSSICQGTPQAKVKMIIRWGFVDSVASEKENDDFCSDKGS